jgi:hypothetical protein
MLEVPVGMTEKRTVFILGAGASCPYGFPTARDLRRQILSGFEDRYLNYLGGAGEQIGAERRAAGYPSLRDAKRFLECFDLSGTESVDLFLSRNPQFEEVGKMVICLSILHAEKDSSLREEVKEREQDWYFYLYNRLTRQATRKDDYRLFGESPVAFVTFNYDRSLEHFLFESLLHSFEGIDEKKAKEQLDKIPIIHVYGRPAPLPWVQDDNQNTLPYGRDIDNFASTNLRAIVANIRVVHKERANPQLEKAREEISRAQRIFFLGFAYAQENLQALTFPGVLDRGHRIYGTATGWTSKEIQGIRRDFIHGLQAKGASSYEVEDRAQIHDCDCGHLLREYLQVRTIFPCS